MERSHQCELTGENVGSERTAVSLCSFRHPILSARNICYYAEETQRVFTSTAGVMLKRAAHGYCSANPGGDCFRMLFSTDI